MRLERLLPQLSLRRTRIPAGFFQWANQPHENDNRPQEAVETKNLGNIGDADKIPSAIIERVRENPQKSFSLTIDSHINKPAIFDLSNINTATFHFRFFDIRHGGSHIVVKNAKLWAFHVHGENCIIEINNCHISEFICNGNYRIKLISKNSWIGKIKLGAGSFRDALFMRGGILGLECPPPQEGNPFLGSVEFSKTYLPRRRRNSFMDGAQPYRNLRAHLVKLENSQAAGLMHVHELDMERETDPSWFNRLLSAGYSIASRYGTSTGWPLAWFGGLWFIGLLVIATVDGAVLENRVPPNDAVSGENATSWRSDLEGDGFWSRLGRSALLAFKSIIGPLILIDSRGAVTPSEPYLVFLLFFLGLFQTAFLFLFFLALRRRFRMQA